MLSRLTGQELITWCRAMKQLTAGVQHKPLDRTAVYHKGLLPIHILTSYHLMLRGKQQRTGPHFLKNYLLQWGAGLVALVPTTTDQNHNLYGLYYWELLSRTCTVILRQITRVLGQLHFQSLPFHMLWSCTSAWHLGGQRTFLLCDSILMTVNTNQTGRVNMT